MSGTGSSLAEATNIKWTPGQTDGGAAAAAPKSQKYWDKHNIERPDYAKTDEELRQERGSSKGSSSASWGGMFLFSGIMALCYYYFNQNQHKVIPGHGSRLGHDEAHSQPDSFFSFSFLGTRQEQQSRASSEEARLARLARFDAISQQPGEQDHPKND
jgi:hypothetical protein